MFRSFWVKMSALVQTDTSVNKSVDNNSAIFIPRSQIPSSYQVGDITFTNKYCGAKYVLKPTNKKNRTYIKVGEVIDEQFVNNKENIHYAIKILRARRNTILAVDWDWIHLFKYQNSLLAHNILVSTMYKVERGILKYLQDINAWNEVVELIIVLFKFWVRLAKADEKPLLYFDTLLSCFASVNWTYLEELITRLIIPSLALRFQNSCLLQGTPFNDVVDMMHSVWLYCNAYLQCSKLETDYLVHNDMLVFITILKRAQPMQNKFTGIEHYLKYAPVKYNENPAKERLLQAISNDPVTREEFRRIFNWIEGQKSVETVGAPHYFQDYYHPRDFGDDCLPPTNYVSKIGSSELAKVPFQTVEDNKQQESNIGDHEFIHKCGIWENLKKDLQNRIDNTLKKKIKNSSVPCKFNLTPCKILNDAKYLDCLKAVLLNARIFTILDQKMLFLYCTLANIIHYHHKIKKNHELILTIDTISRKQFYLYTLFLTNIGIKGYDDPLLHIKHGALRNYVTALKYALCRRPWESSSTTIAKFPADWNYGIAFAWRNWKSLLDYGDTRITFGLFKIIRVQYRKNGPFTSINDDIYDDSFLKLQLSTIFGSNDDKKEFEEQFSDWNKNKAKVCPKQLKWEKTSQYTHSIALRAYLQAQQILANLASAPRSEGQKKQTTQTSIQNQQSQTTFFVSPQSPSRIQNQQAHTNIVVSPQSTQSLANNSEIKPDPTTIAQSLRRQQRKQRNKKIQQHSDEIEHKSDNGSLNLSLITPTPPPPPISTGSDSSLKLSFSPSLKLTEQTLAEYEKYQEEASDFLADSGPDSVYAGTVCSVNSNLTYKPDNRTPMERFKFMHQQHKQSNYDELTCPSVMDDDDKQSAFEGSIADNQTEWEVNSNNSRYASDGGTNATNTAIYNKNIHGRPEITSVRNVHGIVYGKSDWTGVHGYQFQINSFQPHEPSQWCSSKYDVNFYNAMSEVVLWLYQKPYWVCSKDFADNRKISKRFEWQSAFNNMSEWVSEAGPEQYETNYHHYLANVGKPISIVESGSLKRAATDFSALLQQTRQYCDYSIKFFPDLDVSSQPWRYEKDLKNEIIWVHNCSLETLNKHIQTQNLTITDVERVRKCQNFSQRAVSVQLVFGTHYIVCILFFESFLLVGIQHAVF